MRPIDTCIMAFFYTEGPDKVIGYIYTALHPIRLENMSLTCQAKVLNPRQQNKVMAFLACTRYPWRNQAIFLLSCKAGMRAKEIALLRWKHVLDDEGEQIGDVIKVTNEISKGEGGGREIPIGAKLKTALIKYFKHNKRADWGARVFKNQCKKNMLSHGIVCMFARWYRLTNMRGYSSHSGRRTFITNAARQISLCGGSIRDVQSLAGHSTLQMTGRYIEINNDATRKVVDIV